MRVVMQALERSGLGWYITGSEALAAYGSPRQTMDVDVVIEATGDQLSELAGEVAGACYFSEPVRFGRRLMAALVGVDGGGKVDLIVRDPDAWGRAAMARRQRWLHPALGPVWVSSVEDLLLAKLEWSEGSSELQLRDCATLLRMAAGTIDHSYLDDWATRLDLAPLLDQARRQADAT